MTRVWIYTVRSSSDPDNVSCVVPLPVDDDLIFFGPCKARIRQQLRRRYLSPDCNHKAATEDLFIVGVNGGNQQRIRKVIWAGKLAEVMTFAEAYRRLRGRRFMALRGRPDSPLHVRPVMMGGDLVGYEHASSEHSDEDEWIGDLVSKSARRNIRAGGRRLILRHGTAWEGFDRDCCMLLENRFFAQGEGIEFDEEALQILRQAQPEKSGIDHYAVFGSAIDGRPDGLRGRYLEIKGQLAMRFVAWLEKRSHEVARHLRDDGFEPAKTSCTLHRSRSRRSIRCT